MRQIEQLARYRTTLIAAPVLRLTAPCTDVCVLPAAQGGKEPAKAKAQKAAKQVKKSTWKKQRKPRFSVVFHRPKTLKHQRDPKYPRIRCGLASLEESIHAL